MATAESASQLAHAAVVDDLKAEVVELKAEEELKDLAIVFSSLMPHTTYG